MKTSTKLQKLQQKRCHVYTTLLCIRGLAKHLLTYDTCTDDEIYFLERLAAIEPSMQWEHFKEKEKDDD